MRSLGQRCSEALGTAPPSDMSQPRRFNELKPNLSYLVALQDGARVAVFSHSQHFLRTENGSCVRKRIEPHTVVLNCGDIITSRQHLVHHGAASIGVNHRVHWYAAQRDVRASLFDPGPKTGLSRGREGV